MFRRIGFLLLIATPLIFGQEKAKHPVSRHVICAPPSLKLTKMVKPGFPAEAEKKGVFGTVVVEALIDKQGTPQRIRVVKGNPVLVKAVRDAVQQWRWEPYRLNGEAVELETTISVKFEPRHGLVRE